MYPASMHHLPRTQFYQATESRRFNQLLARALLEMFQSGLVDLSIKAVGSEGSSWIPLPAGSCWCIHSPTQADCQHLDHKMAHLSCCTLGGDGPDPDPCPSLLTPFALLLELSHRSMHHAHAHTTSAAQPLPHRSCRAGSSTCMPDLVHAPSRWLLNRRRVRMRGKT